MSEDQQCFEWRATGRLSRGWAAEIYASAITIQIDSLGVSSQDGYPTHARNTTSIRSAQSQTSSFHIEPQVVLRSASPVSPSSTCPPHNPPSPCQAPPPPSSILLFPSAVRKADPRRAALSSETLGSPLVPGMASAMAFYWKWISSGWGWADDQVFGGTRADLRIRIYAF